MSTTILDTLLFFFLEIIETSLQKGNTFSQLINNLHKIKQQSNIKFFAIHLPLIYIIYYYIITQNKYLLIIIAIKVLDLIVKLKLINSVENSGRPFDTLEYFRVNDIEISKRLRYTSAAFYTFLFFMAINQI